MTNHTIREFTGQARDNLTLEKYRHGALWANRYIVSLLGKGWGHKSWELFLLSSSTKPSGQYSLTMWQIVEARHNLVGSLPTIPAVTRRWQTDWAIHRFRSGKVPGSHIASPVSSITSPAIPFRYGPSESSYVQSISGYFNQCLNSMPASDSIPAALVGPHHAQQEGTDSIL
ncbi:hypothetical protein N7450_001786 [Penicillium hetheringtonii]|uniref:Uncharacterized protein n=1 Tax=Penicillium hetheringtonii TaxID=911720 RepID=A0AAD6H1R3_9EURO|nr:hypothetical protein N7450_001786 [Penicillium hetheringtonii]